MPRPAPSPPRVLNSIESVRALAEVMRLFMESRPAGDRLRLERRIQIERGFDAAMASHLQTIHDVAVSCLASDPKSFDSMSRRLRDNAADDDDLWRMARFGLSDYAASMFAGAAASPKQFAEAERRASELHAKLARQ